MGNVFEASPRQQGVLEVLGVGVAPTSACMGSPQPQRVWRPPHRIRPPRRELRRMDAYRPPADARCDFVGGGQEIEHK